MNQLGLLYLSFVTPGRVKSERRAESQEGRMTQPRSPKPSIKFVDEYCAIYRNIFPEIRSFENFRDLHLGNSMSVLVKLLKEILAPPTERGDFDVLIEREGEIALHVFLLDETALNLVKPKNFRIFADSTPA